MSGLFDEGRPDEHKASAPNPRQPDPPGPGFSETAKPADDDTIAPSSMPGPQEPPEAWIGRSLGRYQITDVLGRGGMGIAYRAIDPTLEREVAIKVLYDEYSRNEKSLQRFLREARAAAKLRDNHTVSVFEVGQLDSIKFIVMEYVEGGSLEDQLNRDQTLSVNDATSLVVQACQGLAAAHAQGIIHRDIKPANLLLTNDGTVKIADFGLVKRIDSETLAMTQQGEMMGSPHYMSPEQFRGDKIDHRSDIYSLGATYYTLLTGKPPYDEAENVPQMIYAHLQKDVPDPRQARPDIPQACAQIVQQAMAKSPTERYQNASAMQADLENVNAGGVTVDTSPSSSPTSRTKYALIAALTVVVILGVAFRNQIRRSNNDPVPIVAQTEGNGKSSQPPLPQPAEPSLQRPAEPPLPPPAEPSLPQPTEPSLPRPAEPSLPQPAVPPITELPPIRVGILHSLTGDMASSEVDVADVTEFTFSEINASGGLLGRQIEFVKADGKSNWKEFDRQARRLIEEEKVSAIFGCWSASARKAVTAVVTDYDNLLICPVRYGGLEESTHVVQLGAIPNQQIVPAAQWAVAERGKKRFYLIGSKGLEFPHIANLIIREAVKEAGAQVVGETYLPPGNIGARGIVQIIIGSGADVILSTIQGESNIGFYQALRNEKLPTGGIMSIALSVNERDLVDLDLKSMQDDYAAWTYFQSLETPQNRDFVDRFHATTGTARVINDPMISAYYGVRLWSEAVNSCGTVDPFEVRKSIISQKVEGPCGNVWLDAGNRHAFRTPLIGKIMPDGQFEVVWKGPEPIGPDPFPWKTPQAWRFILNGFQDSNWRFRPE